MVTHEFQNSNVGLKGILCAKSKVQSVQQCGVGVTDGHVQKNQQVVFSWLEVREYPIILGGKSLRYFKTAGCFRVRY